jgi:hypothetical protein
MQGCLDTRRNKTAADKKGKLDGFGAFEVERSGEINPKGASVHCR